ncbi:hypothetical protein BC941DRAFT_491902 [Chlamydoabsidia padenii]|nr:hypothetical protein BC941DRAFT_491902 [Chlamydoabsidia padenii]
MDFLLAVAQNDIKTARHLIQTGIDVNCPILWNAKDTYSPAIPTTTTSDSLSFEKLQVDQEYHSRPLNIAVLSGHVDMVRLLLSAGADINIKDGRGRTALICAIFGLDLDTSDINPACLQLISKTHESHLSIMKNVLLRHPNLYVATLNAPQYEINGITPLCLASYLGKSDIIQLLLEDGRVDVNGTDSKNKSALIYAARDGNLPVTQILLNYGASPDITDSHGCSAIQYAEKKPNIVQLCEEALRRKRSDISMIHAPVNPISRYPTSYAKLSTLISTLPQYQSSLSHLDFNDTLQDIDLMDPITAPLVHLIQTAFLHAIKSHDYTTLQTLLLWSPPLKRDINRSSGALLINHHDTKTGLAAIHHAMRAKPLPSLDTLTMLYQAGADINAQTLYGRTALHHLARIGLDKDGKTWNIQKNAGKQARQSANSSTSATQPIETARLKENGETATTKTQPASLSFDNRLSALIDRSSRSTGSDATNILQGYMVDILDDRHTTSILAVPTVSAHLGLCASLLIQFGALVNIADPTGNTPLHFASEFGGVQEVLKVLILDGNADLHLKNKRQQTPLDICKSEEIRKYMLALEKQRKTSHRTKSTLSSSSNITGNIRPFDIGGDYRHSLTRSVSKSTIQSATIHGSISGKWNNTSPGSLILPTSISEAAANRNKETKAKADVLNQIDADFDRILNAFYSYQTSFTDSIEKALAFITETILQSWQTDDIISDDGGDSTTNHGSMAPTTVSPGQLERMIVQLRFELREAHDMFDQTDQRAEKVMLHYREELERVEQIHQSDCELLDLQQEKVDKLVDVFERIDSRFCQLELDQDELIGQVESWRKLALRQLQYLDQRHSTVEYDEHHLHPCFTNLMQTLMILTTLPPNDPILYLRDDRHRLCGDLEQVIQKVLQVASSIPLLSEECASLQEKWHQVELLLGAHSTLDSQNGNGSDATLTATATTTICAENRKNSNNTSATNWQRQLLTASLYSVTLNPDQHKGGGCRSLNELELSFDILSANLCEIQKDMDDLDQQSTQVMENKKQMYDVCLSLEKELESLQQPDISSGSTTLNNRTEAVVRRELDQVLQCTKALFDRQYSLDQESTSLKKEYEAVEQQLEVTKQALRQVRPPLLLQGLLERLETEDHPMVRVEKDWQEDANLVVTFMEEDSVGALEWMDESDCSSLSSDTETKATTQQRLKAVCKTSLSTRCLISRLDASLYCLKVLTAHHISQSRQSLLKVQSNLSQAKDEVDEAHNQMITLYTEAAEVARQVYVFKTEVEMIIRHRKEEVVKVWEVVDEVSVGIDTSAATLQHQQEQTTISSNPADRHKQIQTTEEVESEDQDRYQWIIRELERFHIVHENLQDAIEELKREQMEIGQRIRQMMTLLIEPQVDLLVGQGDSSLLSVSDYLTELMDGIRMHDLDFNSDDTGVNSAEQKDQARLSHLNTNKISSTVSSSPHHRLSLLSGKSNPTSSKRISLALSMHTPTDRKRMSAMSTSSLSSLSSYQQERMLSRASTLSQALSRHRSAASRHRH